jgi:hypothetical protein
MTKSLSKELGLKEGQAYIIGRKGPVRMENHIYINSSTVSRPHAEMKIKNGKVYLRDMDSTNGIYILENDTLVSFQEGYVKPNQPIVIGKVKCTIQSLISIAGVYSGPTNDALEFEDTQKIGIPKNLAAPTHKPFKSWM